MIVKVEFAIGDGFLLRFSKHMGWPVCERLKWMFVEI